MKNSILFFHSSFTKSTVLASPRYLQVGRTEPGSRLVQEIITE